MTVDGTPIYFFYDGNGKPMFFIYNGTRYFYATNLQGDVTAIVSVGGNEKVEYTYDAWGNILSVTGANAATIGRLNPLRYRGYVYDQPTGQYYLQSRYYSPNLGRFINADVYTSTDQGLLGNNMFAYCLNNPVNRIDDDGASSIWFFLGLLSDWGFVHRAVQKHISANYPNVETEFTGLDVGRADIVQGSSVWEIKHAGTQPILRTAMAVLQAFGYTLVSEEPLYLGAANAFSGAFYISVASSSFLVEYTTPAPGAILYTVTQVDSYSGEYFAVLGMATKEEENKRKITLKDVVPWVAAGAVVAIFGECPVPSWLTKTDLGLA